MWQGQNFFKDLHSFFFTSRILVIPELLRDAASPPKCQDSSGSYKEQSTRSSRLPDLQNLLTDPLVSFGTTIKTISTWDFSR